MLYTYTITARQDKLAFTLKSSLISVAPLCHGTTKEKYSDGAGFRQYMIGCVYHHYGTEAILISKIFFSASKIIRRNSEIHPDSRYCLHSEILKPDY